MKRRIPSAPQIGLEKRSSRRMLHIGKICRGIVGARGHHCDPKVRRRELDPRITEKQLRDGAKQTLLLRLTKRGTNTSRPTNQHSTQSFVGDVHIRRRRRRGRRKGRQAHNKKRKTKSEGGIFALVRRMPARYWLGGILSRCIPATAIKACEMEARRVFGTTWFV